MLGTEGFISIEGIEGSGKSTAAKYIADYLKQKKYEVVLTAEPGGTPVGQKIRELLLEPWNHMDPVTELLLYYASRAQHVKDVISPALAENKIVVTDRFTDSTVAYQGYGRGLSMSIINSLDQIVAPYIKPKITFLLDLEVEEGLRRNRQALKEDRFELEAVEFHRKVRVGFLEIAREEPERFRIIDASKSMEEVVNKIAGILDKEWH
jgi:dTMP kinase